MKVNFWNSSALTGPQSRSGLMCRLKRFREDESGVLAKPMVATLLLMLAVAGIGMDVVRLERDRTELQYTLDRSVLAAADLDQPLDAKEVVIDYMTKSGLGEYTTAVDAEVSVSSRRVSASVDADFDPYWMKFAGYESVLPLNAAATAIESIGNVEISLVLDVSGSMRNNSRLVNLKRAAKEFVQTMDENTEDGNMTISIVPYSTQVSMPEAFLDRMQVSGENRYSHCLNFGQSDFNSANLDLQQTYQRAMHFTIWNSGDYRDRNQHVRQPTCASHDDNPERTALLMSDNVAQLQTYIDRFSPSENTSIDLGMKWGTALLDPSVQPIIAQLADSENPNQSIDSIYADRPVAYSDTETLKVIVMMTDGQNTSQYYVNNSYRDGLSTVWYNEDADVYSTYNPNRSYDRFFWDHTRTWEDHAYGNGTYEETTCTGTIYYGNCYYGSWQTRTVEEPGQAEELTYNELFADTSLKYVYNRLFGDWMNNARYYWYDRIYSYVGSNSKDSRTLAVCDAAKDEGIVVFTIGFEAPWRGQQVLQQCASSASHYYDVDGLEISDAFASIATAIRQLRLTE
ncbi:pilus assembly protein TadG-related protein [Tritonibacter scottomollicae]|uniref:pilus assembly protein TadG-related protein n=1 Tax=Tritonibacter scottomollicae TaxID=483013 RepID=UPI003BA97CE3